MSLGVGLPGGRQLSKRIFYYLRSSSYRMQLVRNAQCPCCESRESETIQHTLFECEAFEEEQEAFLARLYSVCPLARQLTDEYRCRLVMGDKLPREIENPLYSYLTAISKLRLGIFSESLFWFWVKPEAEAGT